jgi:hypothetical protein
MTYDEEHLQYWPDINPKFIALLDNLSSRP